MRDHLTTQVAAWERIGHPALLERFILRNGKTFTPRARIGRKRMANQCFMNAAQHVMRARGQYEIGRAHV